MEQGSTDPADWVWDTADTRWERSDVDNTAIANGSANDENIISQTVYDSDGRVQSTRDILGRQTYNVYDLSGRLVRRVQNYVPQASTDPADWVWSTANDRWEYGASDSTPVDRGSNDDQNIITDTVYDDEGRVQQTIDVRQNVTYIVSDETGRRVMTISNYVPQGMSDPADWVWSSGNARWEDGAGNAISRGSANDQNAITTTVYDLAGRVSASRDAAGIETRYEYDDLGRRIKTIANYVDGVYDSAAPDEDIISQTLYNKGGQVVRTIDARGTQTAFTYDGAGRRLTTTQAEDTHLATTSYTCYDKAGRVLRMIANWDGTGSPDAQDSNGDWTFAPTQHGSHNDRNLITEYVYDAAGRRVQVIDPVGNVTETAYFKDGQVDFMTYKNVAVNGTDTDVITAYRYDGLRRRNLVVQHFVDNGEDPADWIWDGTDSRYEQSSGTTIVHGSDNDQNVIVQVAHDVVGRMTSLRDPRGNLTQYSYDQLNRRLTLTNPLSTVWATAYEDRANGGTRTTMTYPGITGSSNYDVTRDFDRMGRLSTIDYGAPAVTPTVSFAYDPAGNRTRMTENNGTSDIRETTFGYDDLRRLTAVSFDNDGNGTVDETVSYQYDAGGLRTQLTLPDSKSIIYYYDAKGRLVGLKDWDEQHSSFSYDAVNRHIGTSRANGLLSDYLYDPAGRLRRVRHLAGTALRAQFAYAVDARGNRTQAAEKVAQSTTVAATYGPSATEVSYPAGTWTTEGSFEKSTQFSARMEIAFDGDEALLTMGVGPDHGLFDLYINGWFWRSFDGYAQSNGEQVIHIPQVTIPQGETTGKLAIHNRADNHPASTGYVIRFKQLQKIAVTYDEQTIDYVYDALSRLTQADYDSGTTVYDYGYDLAGNLVNMDGTTRTYNAANQMTHDGTNNLTYDLNGNLTNDGVNAYTWDRANRMLTAPGSTSYVYDGLGNRIRQTVSSTVTDTLLDMQPGLVKILRQSDGTNTDHFIHAPRGLHAQYDGTDWQYSAQDGLGSVRGLIDSTLGIDAAQSYDPYGQPEGSYGAGFGFTGEQTDSNGQVYLRARYYNPGIGIFPSLDPFEGTMQRPMSLNGYSWVEGNTPNKVDSSGKSAALANRMNSGLCQNSNLMSNCYIVCSFFGCYEVCVGIPVPIPPPYADDIADGIDDILDGIGDAISDLIGDGSTVNSTDWTRSIPRVGQLDWANAIPDFDDRPPENCDDERLIAMDIRRCPDENYNIGDRGNFYTFQDAFRELQDAVRGTGGVSFGDATDGGTSIDVSSGDEIIRNFEGDRWEDSTTCNGGMHWNILGRGGFADAVPAIATVRCCPCCDDTYADYGSIDFSWVCNLNLKFRRG